MGDTLVYDKIREIPRHFPDLDLALLHLGGTMAFFVMVPMDGKQGVEMPRIVNPKKAIPIHYNDYTVFKSPLEDFKREVDAAGLTDPDHYLAHGEEYRLRMRRGPASSPGWSGASRPSLGARCGFSR